MMQQMSAQHVVSCLWSQHDGPLYVTCQCWLPKHTSLHVGPTSNVK